MTKITFGSVCSGIEAASVAWEPLGFWAEWFSEIEPFPAAVLAHHWPDVPNLGDMLKLPALVAAGEIAAPDILVGGTPCQAFSVAGNRESLADARGGLTLAYVELADAIDRQRAREGQEPCVIVWENVPGVLSTKDNAFGCFLAGLAGEDVPLLPPGKRWTNAGLVLGPKRAVAWRILDAQYFGLAQRRRRVFVVASARNGFDPSAVLLEFDGVRRDSAPRREARQEAATDAGPGFEVAGTLDSRVSGGGFPGSDGAMGGHVVPTPYQDVAHCLNAGGMGRIDYESESFVVNAAIPILEPGARTGVSTTDVRAGMGVGADGDPMFTLQASKQHGVACVPVSPTLRAGGNSTGGDRPPGTDVDAADSLICVSVSGDIAHTLNTANNGKGCSEDGTGRGVPTIAHTVALRGRDGGATAELGGEVATALRASTGGGDKPHVLAFHHNAQAAQLPTDARDTSVSDSLTCSQQAAAAVGMAVRRLTVVECSRLQGFPDDHVRVPYRGKPAADGPCYKALGNSMAVPVMRWIGRRIVRHLNGEI
jgi:DNA (cytosine-5)-methyltransferase 1